MQGAPFSTVRVGSIVGEQFEDPPRPCRVVEWNEDEEWLTLDCGGTLKRYTGEEYTDLGYVFYSDDWMDRL